MYVILQLHTLKKWDMSILTFHSLSLGYFLPLGSQLLLSWVVATYEGYILLSLNYTFFSKLQ